MKFSREDSNVAKGIAIILMYVHHMYYDRSAYEMYTINFFPISEEKALVLSQLCKICVAVFVFLSAYGMDQKYSALCREENDDLKSLYHYSTEKYIKYIVSFAVIFVMAHLYSLISANQHNYSSVYGTGMRGIFYCILDLLGLSNIFGSPTFNGTWWYNGLFIALLLLMPLIYKGWKYAGAAIFFITLFLPRMLALEFTALRWYIVSAVLGLAFSEKDLFVKIRRIGSLEPALRKHLLSAVKICAAFLGAVIISIYRAKWGMLLELSDALLAILVIYLSWEMIGKITIVRKGLAFIGTYSMNMFLIHTFFKAHFFGRYMYYFENAWLNILVLLAATLLFSVVVELLKGLLRLYKITDKMLALVLKSQSEAQ